MMPSRLMLFGALAFFGLCCGGHASGQEASEVERIGRLLQIDPGDIVADVGAGDGEWTVELARLVGGDGRVFANEIEEKKLAKIRRAASKARLENVEAVLGGERRTGLAEACCDAVLLRVVYHHFSEPEEMRNDLFRVLRPGALILIVEFPPSSRGGTHGIESEDLIKEMASSGFELVQEIKPWKDGSRSDRYGLLFRRPLP